MPDFAVFLDHLFEHFLAHPKRILFFLCFITLLVLVSYWIPRLVVLVVDKYG